MNSECCPGGVSLAKGAATSQQAGLQDMLTITNYNLSLLLFWFDLSPIYPC